MRNVRMGKLMQKQGASPGSGMVRKIEGKTGGQDRLAERNAMAEQIGEMAVLGVPNQYLVVKEPARGQKEARA